MVFINVDSLYSNEMIMAKYLKSLIHTEIHVFKRNIIGLTMLMTVSLVAFTLILIKLVLLSPLVEFTEFILNKNKSKDDSGHFLNIVKMEEKMRKNKKRKKSCMSKKVDREGNIEYINEIE